ncbi:hypothetical protein BT93_B0842 [Corymbia citriodora subsp. variegata]|nr:hypothetical protein BT93_B0842 [Corymbia citriodora subsp. variegata]
MAGIDKTTVAKSVYNKLSSHFGRFCSFLQQVQERSSTKEGILQLQKKLLSDIDESRHTEVIEDSEHGIWRIGQIFFTRKVLVVLDDVDNQELIKNLIGNYPLYSGSRLIITTRNTNVLEDDGFKGKILGFEMPKMDNGHALQLFCWHAFGTEFPSDDYREHSNEIVSCMGGLPLAIEVVGSLLKGKNEAFWKETLDKLKNEPEEPILKKLKISYDDSDDYQKQIFLDIACFLFNDSKSDAIYMWAGCNLYPERGIDGLTCRCLIKILDNDKFWMHDQLKALGRQIVCKESPRDFGKRSRLWTPQEALQIIRTKERKDNIEALEIYGPPGSIEITSEQFEQLPYLRFLKFGNGTFVGDFTKYPSKLRWISWSNPPKNFRAVNMYLDHLLVFKLDNGDFTDDSKAWDLIKGVRNLKVLSLTKCHSITTMPDFSKCTGLERLTLGRCNRLKRIESFIGDLQSLIHLEIEGCRKLTYLPIEVGALVKLKHFSLSRCYELRELPSSLENITSLIELDLSHTGIAKLPNSITKLKLLQVLRLSKYGSSLQRHVWQLPSDINMLINLKELDLSGNGELGGKVPGGIGELLYLRILNLSGTGICRIPRTINKLPHLQTLNLKGCHMIKRLPELPTSLASLLLQSESLLTVPNLSNHTNLVELLLSDGSQTAGKSKVITRCNLTWIGGLSRLKSLDLNLLNFPTPPELASLSYLEELTMSHLALETPVQLPSSLLRLILKFFSIRWAQSLPSYLKLSNLSTLEFWSGEVEDIPLDGLPQLENLTVHYCRRLRRLAIPLELRKLQQACVACCPELFEIRVVGLSESLRSFFVFRCVSLTILRGLSYLKNTETLTIERCNVLANIEGLDKLGSLKYLKVNECESLKGLIDASRTNIPDHCHVEIQGHRISMKRYRKKILLDTSNKVHHLLQLCVNVQV